MPLTPFKVVVVAVWLAVSLSGLSTCFSSQTDPESLEPKKIACLGDSITWGFKLADPVHASYPACLRKITPPSWTIGNFGVNGATLLIKGDIPIKGQPAYTQAMNFVPDVVLIMLGTNDLKDINWRFIEDFVPDYSRLIDEFQSLPSRPRIVVCSILPVLNLYPGGINGERCLKVNRLIKKVADINKVDFLDIYAHFIGKPELFVDGIHPNNLGASLLSSLVRPKLLHSRIK